MVNSLAKATAEQLEDLTKAAMKAHRIFNKICLSVRMPSTAWPEEVQDQAAILAEMVRDGFKNVDVAVMLNAMKAPWPELVCECIDADPHSEVWAGVLDEDVVEEAILLYVGSQDPVNHELDNVLTNYMESIRDRDRTVQVRIIKKILKKVSKTVYSSRFAGIAGSILAGVEPEVAMMLLGVWKEPK